MKWNWVLRSKKRIKLNETINVLWELKKIAYQWDENEKDGCNLKRGKRYRKGRINYIERWWWYVLKIEAYKYESIYKILKQEKIKLEI